MRKLSDTMKHLEERRDFVKNEELKRKYQKEGFETHVDENDYQPKNLISREGFVENKELMEKYSREENDTPKGKIFNMKPLGGDEKCLSFSEFLKNKGT